MWKHIFKKELFEMLRDRRVVVGSFLMPALVIFMMFQLIGMIEGSVKKQRSAPITLVDRGENPLASQALKQNEIETVKTAEEGKKRIKDGKAKLVLDIQSQPNGQTVVEAFYDSAEPLSEVMLAAVSKEFAKQSKDLAVTKLASKGVKPEELEPLKVVPQDVADKTAQSGAGLASLIPYLIILWAFYGGFATVSDMVAGEKERGTMETLLISPARRSDIVLGKFLALAAVCFASAVCGLLGVIGSSMMMRGSAVVGDGIQLTGPALASSLIALFPLVMMFAALLILVSTWAKNMRECQTYLTVASFIVLLPAILSNMIGFTDLGRTVWIKFVPILSASVSVRQAILGRPDWTATLGSAVVCGILAIVLFFISRQMFEREEILARV